MCYFIPSGHQLCTTYWRTQTIVHALGARRDSAASACTREASYLTTILLSGKRYALIFTKVTFLHISNQKKKNQNKSVTRICNHHFQCIWLSQVWFLWASPDRPRRAADGAGVQLLHAGAPGRPGEPAGRGRPQPAARHRGRHLQQALPGGGGERWDSARRSGQWRGSGSTIITRCCVVVFLSVVQRRSCCWRSRSILTRGRRCWSSRRFISSWTGSTGSTRRRRKPPRRYDLSVCTFGLCVPLRRCCVTARSCRMPSRAW